MNCTSDTSGPFSVTGSLQTIFFSGVTVGTLDAGDTAVCTTSISMDDGAFTGSGVTSTIFNYVFTGTGV